MPQQHSARAAPARQPAVQPNCQAADQTLGAPGAMPAGPAASHLWAGWRFYAALLLIFLCAVAVRIYYMEHRTAVNMDESLSMTLSTYNGYGWDKDFEEGVEYSGGQLRQLSYSIKPGLAGLLADLGALRRDNRDLPHTNLFYSLLRIAISGAPSLEIFDLLRRGCLLNLLLFTLAFAALYRLGRALYGDDRSLLLVALLAASVNAATLSSFLYVRTYELQALMLIVITLVGVRYAQRLQEGLPCPGYGQFLLDGAAMALCFLSGYFALFYVFMLGLLLLALSLTQGQRRYIPYFLCLLLLALTTAWAIYPPFLLGLFYDRGAEASQKISLAYVTQNAAYILDKFTYIYDRHVLGVGGAFLLLLGALLSRGRTNAASRNGLIVMLLLIALSWALLCFTLAPYKNLRYIMPSVPLTLLLACAAFRHARWRAPLMALFLLCVLTPAFMPDRLDYYKTYQSTPLPPQEQPYVVSLSENWQAGAFIPYFIDTQKVVFYNSCQSLRDHYRSYPQAVLVIDDAQFARCGMADGKDLRKLESYVFFTTYSLQ